jgi:esterase/lipase superfamily enzyme
MTEVGRDNWDRVDIIAHSFGTHLVAWAISTLRDNVSVRVHTIIIPIQLEQVPQLPREAAGHGWRRLAWCLS